jgi:hypothetical protein
MYSSDPIIEPELTSFNKIVFINLNEKVVSFYLGGITAF